MTICIACLCPWLYGKDDVGHVVVTASDRMMTSGDVEYEPDQFKVSFVFRTIMIMAAGDLTVHSEALSQLQHDQITKIPFPTVHSVAVAYAACLQDIKIRRSVATHLSPLGLNENTFIENQKDMLPHVVVDLTNQLRSFPLEVEALVVGCDGDKFGHIYHIDGDGMLTYQHDTTFAAIGTGSSHAKSHFMFSKYSKRITYLEALPIIFGAKKRAEVAPGVGSATDMFFITREGMEPVHERFISFLEKDYIATEKRRQRGAIRRTKALHKIAIDIGANPQETAAPK